MKRIVRSGWAVLCCLSLVLGIVGILPNSVSATDGTTIESLSTDFTEVTPLDFGIADGTQESTVTNSKTPTTSFDKVMLSMNLKITEAGKGVTYFQTREGEGIKFWLTNGHTLYMSNWCYSNGGITLQTADGTQKGAIVFSPSKVFPADSGIVWFDNVEFNLTITTEILDWDSSGGENDLKIGVWFNGVLYDNQYYYLLNINPDTYPLQQSLRVDGGNSVTVHSPFVNKKDNMPEGYTVVTPHDLGVMDDSDNDGGITVSAKDSGKTNADKLMFAANLQYGLSGSYITWLYDDTLQNGIQLFLPSGVSNPRLINYLAKDCTMYAGSKENAIAYGSHYDIDKTVANLEKSGFISTSISSDYIFELWYTTDLVDFDNDGATDDLKLGVWFNGTLYNDMYFYIENCASQYTPYIKTFGLKYISTSQIDLTSVGVAAGVYAADTQESYTSDLVKNSNLSDVTFEVPILFHRSGGTFYYGGRDKAIMFTSTDEGIALKHNFGDTETQLDVLSVKNVGIETINRALNLKISTEVVDTNDILLGVWVNGKYRGYQIADAETRLTPYVGMKTENGATIALGAQANESPDKIEYCLTYGNYTKAKETEMERLSINGVASDTDIVIDTCGVYDIAYTQQGKIYMEEVLVYYLGDANSDNIVDIKDIIRALKVADTTLHEQTIAGLSEAGKKAIGYTGEEKWSDTAAKTVIRDIKNLLVGAESTYEEYTNFENGYLYNGGVINNHLTYTLRTADYISIDDFIDVTVDEPCKITWYPYRRDYRTFSSTDYVSGYTSTKVTSLTKEEVLKVAPKAAYIKLVIEPEDTTKMDPTLLSSYGLSLRVRNLPGARTSELTEVDAKQLVQFADTDGTYTKDFTITLNLNSMKFLEDIWILSSTAKYETTTGAKPTIQYELIDRDTGDVLYYAFPYVIGGNGKFEQQEWRIPGLDPGANTECQDMGIEDSPYDTVRLDFVIPEGVKVYINGLSNLENRLGTDEANEGVKYISHTGLYNYAPTNTVLAFEMAGQMGYDSLVTIVKFTKDGVPICFHDDTDIRFLLTYKDGTSISRDNYEGSEVPEEDRVDVPISNYTYAEIIEKFSAGYKKDPMYKNLNVPTMEEYFDICAKYKMEPQFSVHPALTVEQWEVLRDMMIEQSTEDWNLLEHFYVKTGDLNELKKTQQIFGKNIGGYILIVPSGANANYGLYSIAQRAGFVKEENPNEVDFDGYNLSVAFFQHSSTLEVGVDAALEAGFERIDIYGFWGLDGQEFTKWIDKGVTHYCLDYHTSSGLKWYTW